MTKHLPRYTGLAALFFASFVALNWIYGYVIAFQSETNDCFFLFGRQFLMEFFDHPAGPLRYAGRFFGQFYHYRWVGALIASVWISCFGILFYLVLAKLGRPVSISKVLIPCALLLTLHTSCVYVLHDTLGLCASCGAFLGYLSFRRTALRRAYAFLAAPILYLLLGVYAWLFVAWIVAFEWIDRPRRYATRFNVVYAVFCLAVPLVAWRWVFPIPLRSALVCPFLFAPPFRSGWPVQTPAYFAVDCCVAALFAVSVLLIPFWGRLFPGLRVAWLWPDGPGRRRHVVLGFAILVLLILIHFVRYNGSLAAVVTCRQLYKQKRWDALLDATKEDRSDNLLLQFMANSALSHQGRLLDEMFNYPQTWGTRGLVLNFSGVVRTPEEDDRYVTMYNSDLFFEMGHVNASFRHAYNSMRTWGTTYDVLKRIAECSMVNGNDAMATKYLNVLERTLFHRNFARRYKAILADQVAAEREFGPLRRRLPTVDRNMRGHPTTPLATLLESNADNRMAFDYLTAWLLLDKSEVSLATIAANVRHFRTVGYESLPTHCEEALLLWEAAGRPAVDLHGFAYDGAARERFDQFRRTLPTHGDRDGAAESAQALHGDTYWFYYFFVITPARTDIRGGLGETSRVE